MHLQKIGNGAVVCLLVFRGKIAARELPVLPMVMQAFTTIEFSAARLIRAGTDRLVFFPHAFHTIPSRLVSTRFIIRRTVYRTQAAGVAVA